jgi:uncharacterized protein with GYD domain
LAIEWKAQKELSRRYPMPKYLIKASYVGEGVTGLLKEGGSGRRQASEQVIKALGGSIESMYYAFGETDLFFIVDFPDNISAVTCSLLVNASGGVKVTYTLLLTPEEVDQAAEKGRQLTRPIALPADSGPRPGYVTAVGLLSRASCC